MFEKLRLVSHKLCPYVQRAVIVAAGKEIQFERVDIDLAEKPAWFLAISPTGKTPLLEVKRTSGATSTCSKRSDLRIPRRISGDPLLSADPLERARERAWVEFASANSWRDWTALSRRRLHIL